MFSHPCRIDIFANISFHGHDKFVIWAHPLFHICRCTTFVPGIRDTFKRGPISAQIECLHPPEDSFIKTREISPKSQPSLDACNKPSIFTKTQSQPGSLWPTLQTKAAQEPFRPPQASVAFGDLRVDTFRTSYNQDFKVSFCPMFISFRGHVGICNLE